MNSNTNNQTLKVLHIISGDRWAGAEVQAYTLLNQLKNQVTLDVVLMNEGELANKLRKNNINITVLDESNNSSLVIFKLLRQHIKAFKPDVIHTHRQKENVLGGFANLLSTRAASIRTVHGAPEFTPAGFKKILYGLDNFVGKYLQQGIISVSADLSQKLAKTFPANKIHTVTNGVDIDEIRNNIKEVEFKQQQPDHIHVGLVGRLDPVKRVDIFLEMSALLLKEHSENLWHFHIFGEGDLLEKLQDQAQQLNITNAVTFHGHRLDISSCISALDAVVMPSDHEGLPMTALEAMALNTPLVAHNVGGLTEVLADHPEFLVQKQTEEAYKKTLLSTLDSLTQPLMIKNEYTANINSQTILKIYESYKHRINFPT